MDPFGLILNFELYDRTLAQIPEYIELIKFENPILSDHLIRSLVLTGTVLPLG